jgi:elongation factor 2
MVPFESIKHSSEPVVTVAIEAKNMKDLPKLVEVLRQVSKEDPTLRISINEETGEHLISGMGELHLEIIAHKIERDKNVEITTSEPIVIYRETVRGHAGPVEGKSPNRHNRFYFEVERLPDDIVALIKDGTLTMNMPETERRAMLVEAGMDKEEAKKIVDIFGSNALIDATKGIQYLRETMELIIEGFHEATRTGPLTREPCEGIKVKLVDVTLHEDAVHRGPAQVIPAVRSAVFAAILMADDVLLEPKQKVFINVPQTLMGNATQQIQGRRGQILDIHSEGDMAIIVGKAPVAEMFGFAGDLRSATEGRAIWSTELAGFEVLTQALQPEVVKQIRQRKGLKAELPKPQDFIA